MYLYMVTFDCPGNKKNIRHSLQKIFQINECKLNMFVMALILRDFMSY